jgi:hypothetical protein
MLRASILAACALAAALAIGPLPEAAAADGLRLSELVAQNRSGLFDDDGKTSDWIELENRSDEPVDLAGYKLSDDPALPAKWTLPKVVLPPGAFYLVWASGKNRTAVPVATLAGAKFPIRFERQLVRAGARWRYLLGDRGEGGPPAGWTLPDFDDSSFEEGASGFGYADGDDATLLPEATTAVFIRKKIQLGELSELGQLLLKIDYDDGFIAYWNGTRIASSCAPAGEPGFDAEAECKHEQGRPEYFDLTATPGLLRPGLNVIAIVGLNTNPSTDMSLIPELGTLPRICHTSFQLDTKGGTVILTDPSGREIDRVVYPRQEEDRSYGRPSGTTEWAFFATPTPRAENRRRPFQRLPKAALKLRPEPGNQSGPVEVAFDLETDTSGLEVRFTTDGSEPDGRSPLASEPLKAAASTVVRAAAFVEGERVTPIVSGSYFIGLDTHQATLSLALDPREFAEVHLNENAHGRPSEKRAHLDVYDATGRKVFGTDVGVRLHGGYGRKGGFETKKSYRIYLRNYYGEPNIGCEIISGVPSGALRQVVLRAGFNDRLGAYHTGSTFLRDQVLRRLHKDMGAPGSEGSWCTLLVNGQTKGIYNLVERIDEDFLVRHLGGKEWDLVKTGNEVAAGTREAWDALGTLVRKGRPATEEGFAELSRLVDVANFTSYVILNLWSQNEDWPQNNWYAARPRTDGGQWVFLSWDAEWGLGHTPAGYGADSLRVFLSKRGQIRDLLAALLQNASYRSYFLREVDRYLEGPLSVENVLHRVDEEAARVEPFIPEELSHFAPAYEMKDWERNVEIVRRFARKRGPIFRRLMHETLRALAASVPEER